MSTRNTDELEATPAWGDSKEFVSISADGMSINGKKIPVPLRERDGFLAISP